MALDETLSYKKVCYIISLLTINALANSLGVLLNFP